MQCGITSIVIGTDTQVLFCGNLESEVAGRLCWAFQLRCKCVSCGADCFIPPLRGTENSTVQRGKVEADVQREAEVRKSMTGVQSRGQDWETCSTSS